MSHTVSFFSGRPAAGLFLFCLSAEVKRAKYASQDKYLIIEMLDNDLAHVEFGRGSGAAGMQRFGAAMWSGDISSHLSSLAAHWANQMHMSLSGIDYYGGDIGDFHRNFVVTGDPRHHRLFTGRGERLAFSLRRAIHDLCAGKTITYPLMEKITSSRGDNVAEATFPRNPQRQKASKEKSYAVRCSDAGKTHFYVRKKR